MLACFLFLFYEKIRKNQVEAVIELHPFFSELDLLDILFRLYQLLLPLFFLFLEVQRNT